MSNPMRPIHLDDYPVFEKLEEWRRSGNPEDLRQWRIQSDLPPLFTRPHIECFLFWETRAVKYTICRYAPTVEEAVFLALEAFYTSPPRPT